jgi:hypothetical protein
MSIAFVLPDGRTFGRGSSGRDLVQIVVIDGHQDVYLTPKGHNKCVMYKRVMYKRVVDERDVDECDVDECDVDECDVDESIIDDFTTDSITESMTSNVHVNRSRKRQLSDPFVTDDSMNKRQKIDD